MAKNKTFDLSTLKGYPNNPRTALTEKGREKLWKSLQKNGKFLALREIIYDPETMEILGGNKRFELLVGQGIKDVPIEWVKAAIGLTEQEKKEFVLLDNSHYETEFDYDIIQQYFSDINLDDICITIPNFDIQGFSEKNKEINTDSFDSTMFLKLIFSENEYSFVKERLGKLADTPEKAILNLLKYES